MRNKDTLWQDIRFAKPASQIHTSFGSFKIIFIIPALWIIFSYFTDEVFKEKHFLDELRRSYNAKIIRVDDSEQTYVFYNLPYGEYAVAVLHDENNNRNWDLNMSGHPEEGYGISNYAPLALEGIDFVFGKIKFGFESHRPTLDIRMNYPVVD